MVLKKRSDTLEGIFILTLRIVKDLLNGMKKVYCVVIPFQDLHL